MALKRRELSLEGTQPRKKFRRGLADEDIDGNSYNDFDIGDEGTVEMEELAMRDKPKPNLSRPRPYKCDVEGCDQTFTRPSHMEVHMRKHTGERPYACPEADCDKTYPRKDHLERHIKSEHKKQRDFPCDWKGCGKRFFEQKLVDHHKKTVHGTKYYCTNYPPCYEQFRKKSTLQAHVRSVHQGLNGYICTHVDEETGEQCTATYKASSGLKTHVQSAHSPERMDERFFCMLCPEPGTEVDIVRMENGSVSTPRQPLSFVTRGDLAAHKKHQHPPTCSECGRKFINNWVLQDHIQVTHPHPHHIPTSFPCPELGCERVFNRKTNLNVHVKNVHTDDGTRLHCGEIDFTNSKHEELRTWDGTNACGAPFKSKGGLEQHIRTHHLNLPNRKDTRKEKKAQKQAKRMEQMYPKPSALTLLTGIGYTARNVECLVAGCEVRYMREIDMTAHCADVHKLSEVEIDALLDERREKEALQGGTFWTGGLDDFANRSQLESLQSSMPQTPLTFPSPAYDQEPLSTSDKQFDPTFPSLGVPTVLEPLFEDDAEMDMMMGLTNIPLADVRDGLHN